MRTFFALTAVVLIVAMSGCQSPLLEDSGLFQNSQAATDAPRNLAESMNGSFDGPANRGSGRFDRQTPSPSKDDAPRRRHLRNGATAMQAGDWAGARIEYETALSLNPSDPVAHQMLARIGDQTGQFEHAEYHYLRALKAVQSGGQSANEAGLLSDIGYSYMLQGKLHESKDHLLQAIGKNPTHKQAKINLASLAAYSGDSAGGLAWLKQIAPEPEAQAMLQDILSRPAPFDQNNRTQLAAASIPETDPNNLPTSYRDLQEQRDRIRQQAQRERLGREQQEEQAYRNRVDAIMSGLPGDSNRVNAAPGAAVNGYEIPDQRRQIRDIDQAYSNNRPNRTPARDALTIPDPRTSGAQRSDMYNGVPNRGEFRGSQPGLNANGFDSQQPQFFPNNGQFADPRTQGQGQGQGYPTQNGVETLPSPYQTQGVPSPSQHQLQNGVGSPVRQPANFNEQGRTQLPPWYQPQPMQTGPQIGAQPMHRAPGSTVPQSLYGNGVSSQPIQQLGFDSSGIDAQAQARAAMQAGMAVGPGLPVQGGVSNYRTQPQQDFPGSGRQFNETQYGSNSAPNGTTPSRSSTQFFRGPIQQQNNAAAGNTFNSQSQPNNPGNAGHLNGTNSNATGQSFGTPATNNRNIWQPGSAPPPASQQPTNRQQSGQSWIEMQPAAQPTSSTWDHNRHQPHGASMTEHYSNSRPVNPAWRNELASPTADPRFAPGHYLTQDVTQENDPTRVHTTELTNGQTNGNLPAGYLPAENSQGRVQRTNWTAGGQPIGSFAQPNRP